MTLLNSIDRSQCAIDANQSFWRNPNTSTFLYDQHGRPTSSMAQAWGISYSSCKTLCGSPVYRNGYDWNALSQGLTSWLLPWLALTAQLPFETKDKQTNFMVLLLALGSPSLSIFSLVLTILNSRWINQIFRHVREDNKGLRPPSPLQTKAIKDARVILMEIQHIPIQIINGPSREFAQLIVCPENWTWWPALRKEIQKTKREWTYSLYAQIGWVCVSQLVTIVDFFTSASYNAGIGVGLAINSLWIWEIPTKQEIGLRTFRWKKFWCSLNRLVLRMRTGNSSCNRSWGMSINSASPTVHFSDFPSLAVSLNRDQSSITLGSGAT